MKVNRKSPRHWLYVVVTGVHILLSISARLAAGPVRGKPKVILYGHKFNGNLKVFAEYCARKNEIDAYYLTMDGAYYRELAASGSVVGVLSTLKLRDMLLVARSSVIITDHGPQLLALYNKLTDITFVDAWHGIPYKGFTADDFTSMHNYAEMWVSSPTIKHVYETRLGFSPNQVIATGYARVDPLVSGSFVAKDVRKKYGIDVKYKKIILVAPTWQQDDAGRSILPFGAEVAEFFARLNDVASKKNSLVIFRAHLNVGDGVHFGAMSNLKVMPHGVYPDAEEFLAIADVLVSDWSSILLDYLPLHRPTIFLDVEPPFENGLILGKEHRFGHVVKSVDELCLAIEQYIDKPGEYNKRFAASIRKTEKAAYGTTLDGKAAERYYQRLERLVNRV